MRIFKSFSTTSERASKNGHLYDMDCVLEDVKNILKTRKGEYPMDTSRGCIVYDYLHNPQINESEKQIITDDLEEQLSADPRLADIEVFIEEINTSYYIIINANLLPLNQEINLQINIEDL